MESAGRCAHAVGQIATAARGVRANGVAPVSWQVPGASTLAPPIAGLPPGLSASNAANARPLGVAGSLPLAAARPAGHRRPTVAAVFEGGTAAARLRAATSQTSSPGMDGLAQNLETSHGVEALTFDGAPEKPAIPLAAQPAFAAGTPAFASWRKTLSLKARTLYGKINLANDDASAEVPPPQMPSTPKNRTVAALASGGTSLAVTALAGSLTLSGAAIVASTALWGPIMASVSGLLGAAAVAVSAWRQWKHPDSPKVTALVAGSGFLLIGSSLAPVLSALLGVETLRLTAMGLMIVLALGFEFLNGMHDAANSIATVVTTKVLSARKAVLWAAFFNSIAYFFFGAHIATAIGSGLVVPAVMSNTLLVAALLGASLWNWLTIRLGIPVSSSHALIGGLVGAALVAGGFGALLPTTLVVTATFMIVAPIMGLAVSFLLMSLIDFLIRGKSSVKTNQTFAGLQLASSAMLSLGHGGNDSQKTIGIITALMFANGLLGAQFYVPWFVAAVSYLAMGLGTLAGGWSVIKTMGEKVTSLDRPMGTAAEVGASTAILLATVLGAPVSTTHVVTGAVAGVGAAHNGNKSVHWHTLGKIAWAWALTIPLSALVAAMFFWLIKLVLG